MMTELEEPINLNNKINHEIINNNTIINGTVDDERECRICLEKEDAENKLISPCNCNGTSKYVHDTCLKKWRYINRDNDAFIKCRECNANYIILTNEIENFNFICYKNGMCSYVMFSSLLLFSFMILPLNYIDNINIVVNMLDFTDKNTTSVDLRETFNEDILLLSVFNIISVLSFYFNAFNVYYFISTKFYINNYDDYFRSTKVIFFINLTYDAMYFFLYYFLKNHPYTMMSIMFMHVVFVPFFHVALLKHHKFALNEINESLYDVLSFDSNPYINRNIALNNNVEITNIAISDYSDEDSIYSDESLLSD